MSPFFSLLAASLALQVHTSDVRGLSPSEARDAVLLLLEVLDQQGIEACWTTATIDGDAELPSHRRCGEPSAPEILDVELFAGISRARWIFTRRTAAGASLGQLELDLLRRAPERDRLERGLLWLLPPKSTNAALAPSTSPSPAVAEPSSSPWPAVVGVGAGCAFGVGTALVISALVARQSLDTPSRDLEALQVSEDRRISHGAIGSVLIGVGIGAVLIYYFASVAE